MTLSSQCLFLSSLTFFMCFQLAFLSTAKTTSYIKGIFALTKLKLEEAVYLYEQLFGLTFSFYMCCKDSKLFECKDCFLPQVSKLYYCHKYIPTRSPAALQQSDRRCDDNDAPLSFFLPVEKV